jgi:predicted extracellular nuclease
VLLAMTLAACNGADEMTNRATSLCSVDPTPIASVQGDGTVSPLDGATVVVRGVVTRVEHGTGFYLEGSVGGRNASRAIFVADEALSRAARTAQELAVSGRVEERGQGRDTLTSLTAVDTVDSCAEGAAVPLTTVGLPLSARQREALEGMRLALGDPLSFSDHYDAHRGEWTLSAGQPLRVPTEDADPGSPATKLAQQNRAHTIEIILPGPDRPAVPVGAAVSGVQGVLGQLDDQQKLLLEHVPRVSATTPAVIDPPAPGRLRVVSLNLLNFFNGDGRGGGFPTARGARSPAEFQAQQERTAAGLERLEPHLLAVQELENDGFGPDSAARSLLDLLNSGDASDWAVVDPGTGRIGGDVITVGLFYRRQALEPLGAAALLRAAAFDGRSRVPVAQLFRDRANGSTFLVAVNHLKSKGSCPDSGPNTDQGDGQGCWNTSRTEAVRSLLPWLQGLAEKAGTTQVLILGDMNAWRREDPIQAFRESGYSELVESLAGLPQHSFLYFGQRGTLDYAWASPALARQARHAAIWHINADWPRDGALPQPWLRLSDHDPVVVDFDFSQAATSD